MVDSDRSPYDGLCSRARDSSRTIGCCLADSTSARAEADIAVRGDAAADPNFNADGDRVPATAFRALARTDR